jgi:hypothetical protein
MQYTNLEIDEILKLYKTGVSYGEIERRTGREKSGIIKMLKRKEAYEPRSLRRHSLDENYFDEIDTINKAYWLGFILADAYIRDTRLQKNLVFNLSIKDIDHLEEFKKGIKFSGPIKYITKKKKEKPHRLIRLSITSSHLVKSLIKLGANSFKRNGDLRIIENIDTRLLRYLMRGLFDGDGMVYVHKPSKQTGIGFCDKHYGIVRWFQDELVKNIKIRRTKINVSKSGKCYRFQYRGNHQTKLIGKWLYDEKGVRLNRKKIILNITQGF